MAEGRQAGEDHRAVAREFDVPIAFIDHLSQWQLFGDQGDAQS